MSLVGTRPILQDELRQYELHHRARIAIKPGITGMWQVSGRSDITDFEEVVRLDTEYISKVYQASTSELYGKGYDAATGKMLVCVNPQWFRPTDVDNLWGDPTKAKTVLGWNPQKTSYEELVEIMAKHDRELAKREKAMKAVM